MNIQAIICSFILGIGIVLIFISTRRTEENPRKTDTVMLAIGIIMTFIGGIAYLYTVYEALQKVREKFRLRKLRKMEEPEKTEKPIWTVVLSIEEGSIEKNNSDLIFYV